MKRLLFIPLAFILSLFTYITAYADHSTCIDEDHDNYCDICGRIIDVDVIVSTDSPSYTHVHTGVSGTTTPNGCYTHAYQSREIVDQNWWAVCDDCGGDVMSSTGGHFTPVWSGHEGCPHKSYHNVQSCDVYGYVTRYDLGCGLDEAQIAYGNVNLVKNSSILRIDSTLTDCTITGYSWEYNGAVISTDTSVPLDSVGTYECTVSWTGTYNTSTSVLTYNVTADDFNNTPFYITSELSGDAYVLTAHIHSDVANKINITGYSWTAAENTYTWGILPDVNSGVTPTATTNSVEAYNCGTYTCRVSYEGNSGETYYKDITYNLNDMNVETAAHNQTGFTLSDPLFTYFSQQNIYVQSEELQIKLTQKDIPVSSANVFEKTLGIPIFDENHELYDTNQAEVTIKTFAGANYPVTEYATFDCDYELAEYTPSTCTRNGSSRITLAITMKVYLRNDITDQSYQVTSIDLNDYMHNVGENIDEVSSTLPPNVLNHDCTISSATFIDEDGDHVSDYIKIIRDCPAQSHNYEMWVALEGNLTIAEKNLFNVTRTVTNHDPVSETLCQNVDTTVTYEWLPGDFKTYYVNEERVHQYDQESTPATCLEPGFYHYTCRFCGYSYRQQSSPAKGHAYVWTVKKWATASEDGLIEGRCAVCGMTTTRVIPMDTREHTTGTDLVLDPIPISNFPEMMPTVPPTLEDFEYTLSQINTGHTGRELINPLIVPLLKYDPNLHALLIDTNKFTSKEDEHKKPWFDKLIDILKNGFELAISIINGLIDFFREHPAAVIISLVVFIILLGGGIAFFIFRDRIRFKKASKEDVN